MANVLFFLLCCYPFWKQVDGKAFEVISLTCKVQRVQYHPRQQVSQCTRIIVSKLIYKKTVSYTFTLFSSSGEHFSRLKFQTDSLVCLCSVTEQKKTDHQSSSSAVRFTFSIFFVVCVTKIFKQTATRLNRKQFQCEGRKKLMTVQGLDFMNLRLPPDII